MLVGWLNQETCGGGGGLLFSGTTQFGRSGPKLFSHRLANEVSREISQSKNRFSGTLKQL